MKPNLATPIIAIIVTAIVVTLNEPSASVAQVTNQTASREEPTYTFASTHPTPLSVRSAFQDRSLALLAWVAVLAFVTAAVLQTAKELLGIRGFFNKWRVKKWIRARAWETNFPDRDVWKQFSDASEPLSASQTFNSALRQFEQLSSASRARFFRLPPIYELSPEQLCGQIASGAEVAVAAPYEFRELFQVLTAGPDKSHKNAVAAYLALAATKSKSSLVEPDAKRYAELRGRVMTYVQRSLDTLQIELGSYWRKTMLLSCFAVGIGLSWTGLPLLIRASDPDLRIFCGVAAGMLAPVARDMMAAVQGLRRA